MLQRGRCHRRSTQFRAHVFETLRQLRRSLGEFSFEKIHMRISEGRRSMGFLERTTAGGRDASLSRSSDASIDDTESFFCEVKKSTSSSAGGSGELEDDTDLERLGRGRGGGMGGAGLV